MSRFLSRVRTRRSVVLLLTVVILGAVLAAPTLGRNTAAKAASVPIYTRIASCEGLDFFPADSGDSYSADGAMRFRINSTGDVQGFFICNPDLPNGAVVRKVQFMVRDTDPGFNDVLNCALVRSSISAQKPGAYQLLSGPMRTTHTPGNVRLTDTSIAFATVDNSRYGYWLQCQVQGYDNKVGLFGADVVYTISASKG